MISESTIRTAKRDRQLDITQQTCVNGASKTPCQHHINNIVYFTRIPTCAPLSGDRM